MKKKLVVFAFFCLLFSIPFISQGQTHISSNITVDTTWDVAGSPYIIDSGISIISGVTLRIDPGVTVQFAQYKSLTVAGVLNASGTGLLPIVFTGTSEIPNWWECIYISTGTAVFDYCTIKYGGYWDETNIYKTGTGALTLTNSTVSYSSESGLFFTGDTGTRTLSNNTFSNNKYGVRLANGMSYEDTTSSYSSNTYNILADGGTTAANVVWNVGSSYSIYVKDNYVVGNSTTLTVKPGNVVKMAQYKYLAVDGTLNATGTALSPIYFTDLRDDTVGGDANGDGALTLPAPGWWNSIYVRGSSTAVLDYCSVRYGGYWDNTGIYKTGTGPLTLTNSTVSYSSEAGLFFTGDTGTRTLSNNTFSNNKYGVRLANGMSYDETTSSYSSNTYNIIADGGTTTVNVLWNVGNSYSIYVTDNYVVGASTTLTVKSGNVVKMAQYKYIAVDGTLNATGTELSRIYFTDLRDDTVGGDANGDGALTLPAPGWWNSIYVRGSGMAVLDYCTVKYGGYWDNTGIYKTGTGSLTLTNSTVSYSSEAGLFFTGDSGTRTLSNNTFSNNKYGVRLAIGMSYEETTSSYSSNTYNIMSDGGTITISVVWDVGSLYSIYIIDNYIVGATGTLTVKPGNVVKMAQNKYIMIDGTLNATGTELSRIYFTDLRDDTVGGDANGDQGATPPAPGWWNSIYLRNGGTAVLDYCTVRYGGYWDNVNIYKTGTGNLTMNNCVVSNSSLDGIKIVDSTGTHTIADSSFTDNTSAGFALLNSAADVSGCLFHNNIYGVWQLADSYLDYGSNVFTGNTSGAVAVEGTMDSNVVWSQGQGDDFFFLVTNHITINQGITLTVNPGTTVKFAQYKSITVNGTLNAAGISSSPVIFTGSTETTGWWDSIYIQNSGSADLEYCNVSYGGYWYSTDIYKTGSGNLTLKNSSVTSSIGTGLYLNASTGIHDIELNSFKNNVNGIRLTSAPAGLGIHNCSIESNSGYGILNEGAPEIDATGNWWGNASGPQHATNPSGTGDKVSDFVVFDPWKTSENTSHIKAPMHSGQILAGDTLNFIGAQPSSGNYSYSWNLGQDRASTLLFPGLVTFAGGAQDTDVDVTFAVVDAQGVVDPYPDTRTLTVKVDTGNIPDLKVTSFNVPSSLNVGETYNISYTAKNIGAGAISAGSWKDTIYLSRDIYLDDSDTALSSASISSKTLAVDESYTGSISTYIPAVSEGQSYLILSIDDNWSILEKHQLNNEFQTSTSLGVAQVASGQKITGSFTATSTPDYYKITILAGQSMYFSFTGNVIVYFLYGGLPSLGQYDYKYSFASGGKFTIPGMTAGAWYIMVVPDPGAGGTTDYEFTPEVSEFILSDASPKQFSNAAEIILTLSGAGFAVGAETFLVSSTGSEYQATSTTVDSYSQISANFAAGTIPAGNDYSVKLTQPGKTDAVLSNIIDVIENGKAELVANIMVPERVGYHQLATIYVEYSNVGNVAMSAPIMLVYATQNDSSRPIMTLDNSILSQGFWTSSMPNGFSNQICFLASGATPGILQPGETVKIPIYYAGWQQPWDFSYPPIKFNLGYLTSDNTEPLNMDQLKISMRPQDIPENAWDSLWTAFSPQLGNTWGEFLLKLDAQALALFRLGKSVTDITELLNSIFSQSTALSPITLSAFSQDVPIFGTVLPLGFARMYSPDIARRYETGPFGFGWTHEWEISLTKEVESGGTNITVTIAGDKWKYQPDSRGGFFSMTGDHSTLSASGDGYTLTKSYGLAYKFDNNGRFTYVEDPNGNRITALYSGDKLTGISNSDGYGLTISYNSSGRITGITDSNGNTTTYTFDSGNKYLESVTKHSGAIFAYSYEKESGKVSENDLTQIAFPDGRKLNYTYDSNGRISGSYYNDNKEAISFSYGTEGKITFTNALSQASNYFYDNNKLLVKVTDPNGNSDNLNYDASYNLIKETNASGFSNVYKFDSNGDKTSFIDSKGGTNNMTYAKYGDLAELKDANGNMSRFSHDSKGNLSGITYADGRTNAFTYNAQGNVTQQTNGNGKNITCAYNSSGQMIEKEYADGSLLTYTYDANGRISTATDANGTTTIEYAANGQIAKISYPNERYLEYTYDASARRTSMADQLGNVTNYSYGTLGHISSITNKNGDVIISYSYDSCGRRVKELLGNGVYTLFEYNANNQVTKQTNHAADDSVISSFEYEYNAISQCTAVTTVNGKWVYGYDPADQLISAVFTSNDVNIIPNQSIAYNYDAMGNRTSTVVNGVTSIYKLNSVNQYTTAGTSTYSYDANGNMISSADGVTTWNYTYDDESRIVRAENGTDTYLYGYDPFGRRTSSTKNGVKTEFVIDPAGFGNVVAEYDAVGALSTRYEYGAGLISRSDASNNPAYYTYDGIGNTSELTNATGTVLNTYAYKPFGGILKVSETVENNHQFVGFMGITTAAGNLFDMRTRLYSPELGRFIQFDPLGLAGQDFNLMRYVSNIPTQYIDPNGEFIFVVPIALGILGLTAVVVAPYVKNFSDNMSSRNRAIENAENGGREFDDATDQYIKTRDRMKPLGEAVEQGIKMINKLEHPYVSAIQSPNDELQEVVKRIGGKDSASAQSQDPNEKVGPGGYGINHYIGLGSPFSYRIDYENTPDASAPAQVVSVTDSLSSNLDWSTFEITETGFGDHVISVPDNTRDFQYTEPMVYNGKTLDVNISIKIDQTGKIITLFSTIDPDTGLPPEVDYGFLPPEDGTGRGKGYFCYTISPKASLATGTEIKNVANIVFDFSKTIATNQVSPEDPTPDPTKECPLMVDATPPTSSVAELAVSSPLEFKVEWAGTDTECGIATYSVYVQDNNGVFTQWLSDTTRTYGVYSGTEGHTYGFYSIARDNVGNFETAKAVAESSTTASSAMKSVPVLYTTAVTVHGSDRLSGGNVLTDGGSEVTVRGVCWSIFHNPTTANFRTNNGSGEGEFDSLITDLQPDNTYYVRAYATNSLGTAYGDEFSFQTAATDKIILTLDVSPDASGTVTPVGETEVTAGIPVDITATASEGFTFLCWDVSDGEADIADAFAVQTTATIAKNAAVTANFANGEIAEPDPKMSITLDTSKASKDSVAIVKAVLPNDLPDGYNPADDDVVVIIDQYEFAIDKTTWKPNSKGTVFTAKSAKSETDPLATVLSFDTVKKIWNFKASKASISSKVDNSDGVIIGLFAGGKYYKNTFLMNEATSWVSAGEELRISGLGGTPMTQFSLVPKAKVKGNYSNVKLGKDGFSIDKGTLELPAAFDKGAVSGILIHNLQIPLGPYLQKPGKEVYTYNTAKNVLPAVSSILDLTKNAWSVKISKGDCSSVSTNAEGINIILTLGDYKDGVKLKIYRKIKLSWAPPK